jgi:type IV secretory pathway VirB3-like protein
LRELENMVKRIVVLGDEEFALADLAHAGRTAGFRRARFWKPEGTSLKVASRVPLRGKRSAI